jgi:hypothetical protein
MEKKMAWKWTKGRSVGVECRKGKGKGTRRGQRNPSMISQPMPWHPSQHGSISILLE